MNFIVKGIIAVLLALDYYFLAKSFPTVPFHTQVQIFLSASEWLNMFLKFIDYNI